MGEDRKEGGEPMGRVSVAEWREREREGQGTSIENERERESASLWGEKRCEGRKSWKMVPLASSSLLL